jgi:hypothetical protein
MRRVIAILTLAAGSLLVVQGVTAASPGIGQGPCHHGNSNKDCRPDPQPLHGKDCEHHGGNGKNSHANTTGNGSGNQDHCLAGTVTPSPTPTPSPSSSTPGGTSVQGVTLHRPTVGSLAKTGPNMAPAIGGVALLLIGLGMLLQSFDKRRALQS